MLNVHRWNSFIFQGHFYYLFVKLKRLLYGICNLPLLNSSPDYRPVLAPRSVSNNYLGSLFYPIVSFSRERRSYCRNVELELQNKLPLPFPIPLYAGTMDIFFPVLHVLTSP